MWWICVETKAEVPTGCPPPSLKKVKSDETPKKGQVNWFLNKALKLEAVARAKRKTRKIIASNHYSSPLRNACRHLSLHCSSIALSFSRFCFISPQLLRIQLIIQPDLINKRGANNILSKSYRNSLLAEKGKVAMKRGWAQGWGESVDSQIFLVSVQRSPITHKLTLAFSTRREIEFLRSARSLTSMAGAD